MNIMIQKAIRLDILRWYYELYQKEPMKKASCWEFKERYNVSINELMAQIKYLHDGGFLECQLLDDDGWCNITKDGIDCIENPKKFEKNAPFISLQQQNITVGGDLNAPVIQANEMNIENSFNKLKESIDDSNNNNQIKNELKAYVDELRDESRNKHPDNKKCKSVLDKIKNLDTKVWMLAVDVMMKVQETYYKFKEYQA